MEDRRLPRPIGGERQERAWKNNGTSGVNTMGNITPFNPIDCLDATQISQPISIQPQGNHSVGHGNSGPAGGPNPQQQPWLSMYAAANANQQQSQYTNSSQQQQQPHVNSHGPPGPNRDSRNFLGRRFIEEVDANRLLEIQQQHMYDVRGNMMNGGGVPPMMHMQNPGTHQQPMYPFNLEHLEQHPIPKIDHNSWGDSHLLMDDKHMGWGSGNKWGN